MSAEKKQLALLGPKLPDGSQPMLRMQEGADGGTEYASGVVQPLEDGKPLNPEAEELDMKRIENSPFYEVLSMRGSEHTEKGWHKGPAKVTSNAYREGYDRIFSRKPRPEELN